MNTVMVRSGKVVTLLGDGVTSNTTGNPHYKDSPYSTFQATVTGTGALAATVKIEASNDNVSWCSTALGTITLSGSDSVSDGFTTTAPWKYVRAVVSGLSGTGATVTANMGI